MGVKSGSFGFTVEECSRDRYRARHTGNRRQLRTDSFVHFARREYQTHSVTNFCKVEVALHKLRHFIDSCVAFPATKTSGSR